MIPIKKWILLLLALICALCLWVFADFIGLGGKEVTVAIPSGSGAGEIVRLLKEEKVIQFPSLFQFYIREEAAHLRAGVHTFQKNMGYAAALRELVRDVPLEHAVSVTIPEGYEAREIGLLLESAGLASAADFAAAASSAHADFSFLPEDGNIEGYLFPATYAFLPDDSAETIVHTMVKAFQDKMLTEENKRQAEEIGMSFHEVLTLASLIEREAALDTERSLVSSVFHNRLEKNMRLESCATVQYILKERREVLSYADTKISSPYNTYQNAGLPPSPIASPGLASLAAALHPAKTDYLFFVASGSGGHIFSKTYDEHLAASGQ